MRGSRNTRCRPTHGEIWGEHSKSTQDPNPGPSYCEGTVLTMTALCHPNITATLMRSIAYKDKSHSAILTSKFKQSRILPNEFKSHVFDSIPQSSQYCGIFIWHVNVFVKKYRLNQHTRKTKMFTQHLTSHVLKAGKLELNEITLSEGIFTCMSSHPSCGIYSRVSSRHYPVPTCITSNHKTFLGFPCAYLLAESGISANVTRSFIFTVFFTYGKQVK